MKSTLLAHLRIVRPSLHPSRSKAGRAKSSSTNKVKAFVAKRFPK